MLMIRGRSYGRMGKKRAAVPATGGGALLTSEANGWATDFLYPVDAQRVALKASGVTTSYPLDGFISNLGTSPKMVYDVAGTLGWSPHNMFLRSQELDNAAWAIGQATVGANATAAPDGTTTADAFIPNSGSVQPNFLNNAAVTVISGGVYTYSVYVKNGTLGNNWFRPACVTTGQAQTWFNLATGTKGTTTGTGASSTITPVGNGWYRVTVTWTTDGVSLYVYNAAVGADASASAITGNGTSPAFYVWGAQLNRGPVALPYLPTTNLARCGVAVDYDPVTHTPRGMWAEPAATNLLVQSSAFNTTWVPSQVTIGVNSTTAPDGSATADKILDDTSGANHIVYQGAVLTAAAYTLSAYFKAAERSWALLALATGLGAANAFFNLASGVVGTVLGGTTAAMVSVGNGWYRCSITITATAATYYSGLGGTPADNTFNYVGNGTGVYAWGAQLETGTVATSPIPTLAASVTRASDYVFITPAQINYSATVGSWWLKVRQLYTNTDPNFIRYSNGAQPLVPAGSAVLIWAPPDTLYSANIGVPVLNNSIKMIAAFQAGDGAVTARGVATATAVFSATTLLAPGGQIMIGAQGANLCPGYYEQIRYLPRRPSNSEMQASTVP